MFYVVYICAVSVCICIHACVGAKSNSSWILGVLGMGKWKVKSLETFKQKAIKYVYIYSTKYNILFDALVESVRQYCNILYSQSHTHGDYWFIYDDFCYIRVLICTHLMREQSSLKYTHAHTSTAISQHNSNNNSNLLAQRKLHRKLRAILCRQLETKFSLF